MTHREIAEKIDIQKNCDGIDCVSDKCQFYSYDCTSNKKIVNQAKQWLIDNPKEQNND